MPTPDFEKLNQKIREAGAEWVAGKTPFSKYHGSRNKHMILGLALTPEAVFSRLSDIRNSDIMMAVAPPPPPRIDWRNEKGKNWVTAIKDQGGCGSCVAFSTVATLESRAMIKENKTSARYDLSEAHLFYCGTPNSCELGWQPSLALAFAASTGVGEEAAFPYTPGNQVCRSIPPVIKAVSPSTAGTSAARKRALLDGPVIASFAVYDDFFSYKSGVYRHVVGNLAGYHSVCVVGYDDGQGCWVVKNSWATGWGENGFFRIRYGECGIDTQFPFEFPTDVDLLGNQIP